MDDHGYDQAACRRAAELLRERAEQIREQALEATDAGMREALGAESRAHVTSALWLEAL